MYLFIPVCKVVFLFTVQMLDSLGPADRLGERP